MKKRISLVLLLAMLILLFTSCETGSEQTTTGGGTDTSVTTSPTEGPIDPPDDGIDYIRPPKDISYELDSPYLYDAPQNILLRFDVKRRRATIACPDPLCDHGDKCPVNGVFNVTVAKDYIYFRKSMTDIYCYRLAENKVEKIFQTNGQVDMNFVPIGTFMYFSACEYEISKTDGSVTRRIWNFYRYNAETNKVEKLSDTPLLAPLRVKQCKNGRLRLEEESGKSFYTDMDFTNRSEEWNVKSSENFELTLDYVTEGMILGVTDLSTGENQTVASGITSLRGTFLGDSYNLDQGYLVYGWLYIPGELNEKRELIPFNRVCFVDKETLSTKVLWEGEEPYRVLSAYQDVGNALSSGGYIGLRLRHLEDGMETNGLLIVNPMKNESFVILCEQTRREAAKVVEEE